MAEGTGDLTEGKVKSFKMHTEKPKWELKLFLGDGRAYLGVHWGTTFKSWQIVWRKSAPQA